MMCDDLQTGAKTDSLSQRERVRVRENSFINLNTARC